MTTPARARPRAAMPSDDAKEDELLGIAEEEEGARRRSPHRHDDGSSARRWRGRAPRRRRSRSRPCRSEGLRGDRAGRRRSSALEFGLGAQGDVPPALLDVGRARRGPGPYTLTPGPETGLWLEFYPAAFGTRASRRTSACSAVSTTASASRRRSRTAPTSRPRSVTSWGAQGPHPDRRRSSRTCPWRTASRCSRSRSRRAPPTCPSSPTSSSARRWGRA